MMAFQWQEVLLGLAILAGFCCLLASLAHAVRETFSRFEAFVYLPLQYSHQSLSSFCRAAAAWLRTQLGQESVRQGDGPIYFIVGSILYSLLTVLFVLCDFGMLTLTYQAMGLEASHYNLPLDTSTLAGGTLISAALFAGMLLTDLYGVTHLAPWARVLNPRQMKVLKLMAFAMFVGAVTLAVSGGLWRAQSLGMAQSASADHSLSLDDSASMLYQSALSTDPSLSLSGGQNLLPHGPDDNQLFLNQPDSHWALKLNMMGIAALSITASAASGVGMAILAKLILLGALALLLLPVLLATFLAWLTRVLLSGLLGFLEALLGLLITFGQLLLDYLLRMTGYLGAWLRKPTSPQTDPTARPPRRQTPQPAQQTASAAGTSQQEPPPSPPAQDSPSCEPGGDVAIPDSGFNPFA